MNRLVSKRHVGGAAAAAVMLAASLSGCAPGDGVSLHGATGGVEGRHLTWRSCAENAKADCATLTVPVDWSQVNGEKFDMRVVRIRASDAARRVGTLVFSPGGPGGSGADAVIGPDGAKLFSPEVMARFDIVGFDQRGLSLINGAKCDTKLIGKKGPAFFTPGYNVVPAPGTEAEFNRWRAASAALYSDCRKRNGPLYEHIDTASVARDLEALRVAMGDDRISIYSHSYGTLLGQLYAEKFPTRVRGIILDGVLDHSQSRDDWFRTGARGTQDSFDAFASWCAKESACPLHDQNIRQTLAETVSRAEKGTLGTPGATPKRLSSFEVIRSISEPLASGNWQSTAAAIKWLADLPTAPPIVQAPATHSAVAPNALTTWPFGTVCADFSIGVNSYRELERLWSVMVSAAPDMRTNPFGWLMSVPCVGWPNTATTQPAATTLGKRSPTHFNHECTTRCVDTS